MHAMYLMIAVLCVLAIAYRFYSAFIAAKVLALDDARPTPAHRLNDGQNYHPTNKWVLFGHHFAAISGAGPLLGPVLAAQFGYLPGLLWILIGVVLAGAVQDFVVLALSIRRDGRSLARIAYQEIGPVSGGAATLGILFVLVIALAGLGKAVTKALGGEDVLYRPGTRFVAPKNASIVARETILPKRDGLLYGKRFEIPAGSSILEPDAKGNMVEGRITQKMTLEVTDNGKFADRDPRNVETIRWRRPNTPREEDAFVSYEAVKVELPAQRADAQHGVEARWPNWGIEITDHVQAKRHIAGSRWGLFSIALTIPIALFTSWWMYYARKGRVLEASIVGGLLTLGAVWIGAFVAEGQPLAYIGQYLDLSENQVAVAMAIYGFVASVLPVWILLCPRDYLSSFLKIGTVALLVLGVIIANPVLQAPAINTVFLKGGPTVPGNIFPFVFITIMCGAISGFHALVSSGTTPKMISKETQARTIGYGAMLIEGLVGIVALIAATALPTSQYYQMNTAWADVPKYQNQIAELAKHDATKEDLSAIETRVGEQLQGRTGGAVTLAVGMADIFDRAARNLLGAPRSAAPETPAPAPPGHPATIREKVDGAAATTLSWLEGLIPYWYHFAIMFEALFILTTIDTGTRVGRFLLQETIGKVYGPFGRTNWWPGAILSTGLVVAAWWYFLRSNSMAAIWPMFGIANQMLAVWALAIASAALVRSGKARYVWVTLAPMVFVTLTTTTAAVLMVRDFVRAILAAKRPAEAINPAISAILIVGIVACTVVILIGAARRMGERPVAPAKEEAIAA